MLAGGGAERYIAARPDVVNHESNRRMMPESSPEQSSMTEQPIRFAAAGDIHGHYRELVERLNDLVAEFGPIDFCIGVGDCEPLRDADDLASVKQPTERHGLGDFSEVVSGELVLPCPLLVIGGNHDPWIGYDALGYDGGGWSDGVEYLGRAGVKERFGLRIAYLSGLRSRKYSTTPRQPLAPDHKRYLKRMSRYDSTDVERVKRATGSDILVCHDWPSGIDPDPTSERGDETIREIIHAVGPSISLHGHRHVGNHGRIADTNVHCLGNITRDDSIAVFESTNKSIRRIDASASRAWRGRAGSTD